MKIETYKRMQDTPIIENKLDKYGWESVVGLLVPLWKELERKINVIKNGNDKNLGKKIFLMEDYFIFWFFSVRFALVFIVFSLVSSFIGVLFAIYLLACVIVFFCLSFFMIVVSRLDCVQMVVFGANV